MSTGLFGALRRASSHLFTNATGPGRMRLLVQIAGVAVGLALLAWCVSLALRPENRENLERLRGAPWRLVVLLFSLSGLTLIFNGIAFWITLRPVRKLPVIDMIAANSVASAMSYLPFKLSVVSRFIIHNRRDGIPLLTIGSWLGANAVVVLAVLGTMGLAGLWRGGVDAAWIGLTLGGMAVAFVCVWSGARTFAGEAGLARLERMASWTRIGLPLRLVRAHRFRQMHAGLSILADARTLAAAMAVRVLDTLAQSARFAVAATAIGVPLTLDKAVLAGSTFHLLGIVSPAGSVGGREGATTSLAVLIPGITAEAFSVVTLTVSASEILVFVLGGVLGAAWLRPARWLRSRDPAGSTIADASGPGAAQPDDR